MTGLGRAPGLGEGYEPPAPRAGSTDHFGVEWVYDPARHDYVRAPSRHAERWSWQNPEGER